MNLTTKYELTDHEKNILQICSHGRTIPEVAEIMGIAPSTAKNIRHNILDILDAKNTTHAVAMGFRNGWIR